VKRNVTVPLGRSLTTRGSRVLGRDTRVTAYRRPRGPERLKTRIGS
jgi:hypothetical protein